MKLTTQLLVQLAFAAGIVFVNPTNAVADVTIDVIPALAPNAFGSPSYSGWYDNAVNAIYAGAVSYGDPTLPTYYTRAPSEISVSNNVVTGFPSWQGTADPGTVFGPAYANELGNRLAFGVDIRGNGTLISISQLSFSAYSTDPLNTLDFSFGTGSYQYSDQYRGLNYGPDGIRGTADDIWVTSGPATQLVDEIIGRGSGNAWDVYTSSPGLTLQDKINGVGQLFELGDAPFTFAGTYSLGSSSGSASVTIDPVWALVPEPPTSAVAAMGLAALWAGRLARNSRRINHSPTPPCRTVTKGRHPSL